MAKVYVDLHMSGLDIRLESQKGPRNSEVRPMPRGSPAFPPVILRARLQSNQGT